MGGRGTIGLSHWHWQVGALEVMLACWGSVTLKGLHTLALEVGSGQAVQGPEAREAGLQGLSAAQALLEDWVLGLA